MISGKLIKTICEGACIQRWNDHIRPIELTELDKQAHKACIAYIYANFIKREEPTEELKGFEWQKLIEGMIFEYLERIVITDLKPKVFEAILRDKREELLKFVFGKLEGELGKIGKEGLRERCRKYFFNEEYSKKEKQILKYGHDFSTLWEFLRVIRPNNLKLEGFEKTEKRMIERMKPYYYTPIKTIDDLENSFKDFALLKFLDHCFQLRFQQRWSQTVRIPKTTVLGHMFIVAILVYLCSLENGIEVESRIYHNFFSALFHDLPEVFTRDIISPLKRDLEIEDFLEEYERKEIDENIIPLFSPNENWQKEIKYFLENQFKNRISNCGNTEIVGELKEPDRKDDGEIKITRFIDSDKNREEFKPTDGVLVLLCDKLAAFAEASMSIKYGISSQHLYQGMKSMKEKYADIQFGNVHFGRLFNDVWTEIFF